MYRMFHPLLLQILTCLCFFPVNQPILINFYVISFLSASNDQAQDEIRKLLYKYIDSNVYFPFSE